jgi:hypothetical protein
VSGIQERVSANISSAFKNLADFFRNVVTGMVQHVGDVFEDDRERCARFHVLKILDVKASARIVPEGFRMIRDFPQL